MSRKLAERHGIIEKVDEKIVNGRRANLYVPGPALIVSEAA